MDSSKQVLKFIVFWWLVFTFQRVLFSIHHADLVLSSGWGEFLGVFFQSFRLDLAMIGFIALATLPFWLLYRLSKGKIRKIVWQVMKWEQIIILLLISMIHVGEINAYGEWMHKLSVRVFNHLINPDEVFRTATGANYFFFFLYVFLEMLFGIKVLKKMFRFEPSHSVSPIRNSISVLGMTVVLGGLSFLSARGGWQPIPIGINSAMFSVNPVLNDVSVNSTYFFLHSLRLYGKVELDHYLEEVTLEESKEFTTEVLSYTADHTAVFLAEKRPNIIVVVLESWAADAISYSGLHDGTTPHFDKMISEGVYCSEFYAAAGTSEIGNAAIFGGYPALPQVSLTMHPEKSRKLKSLNQTLKPYGYYSSYLFGGDLKYGNIGGYFLDHQFDKVMDEKDFDPGLERGVLNVYDEDLYKKFLQEINQTKEPFLQIAFSGSTHSPYDIPEKWKHFWKGDEAGIMNSIRYADHALYEFVENCRKEEWFEHTLFVFVADHGRTTPTNQNATAASYFRVPLLFWGPLITEEFRGFDMDKIATQSDFVATLLYQMDIPSDDYPWSRDIMSPDFYPFAVYSSSLGYGCKDEDGDMFWFMNAERFTANTFSEEQINEKMDKTRKYLKVLWEEFKAL